MPRFVGCFTNQSYPRDATSSLPVESKITRSKSLLVEFGSHTRVTVKWSSPKGTVVRRKSHSKSQSNSNMCERFCFDKILPLSRFLPSLPAEVTKTIPSSTISSISSLIMSLPSRPNIHGSHPILRLITSALFLTAHSIPSIASPYSQPNPLNRASMRFSIESSEDSLASRN